ncbi:MAG: diguanylate cyclase [Nitrospinae bacterium]|nr:diguanylate cyclase [Nitrospinota bacterium]
MTEASALQRRPIAGGRVLVVSAQAAEIAAIGQVLADDELVLQALPDQRTALARAVEMGPDLAIIDAHLPDGEGAALIRPLRARLRRRQLPILLLTEGPDTVGTLQGGEAAVTDYLAKPFSPPMLRARVRAWLARTLMTDRTKPAALSQRKAIKAVSSRRSPTEGIGSEPGTITRYASLLASVPTFRRLSREQLHRLVAQATEQVYSAGQALVRQGEPGDRLFVVLSGHVRVVEAAPEIPQGELFLGELGPGEIVGELGILRKQPRSATVLAVGRTHCLVLPKHDFSQVLQSSPDLAVALLRMLAERLHDADQMLARYAPDPLTGLASRRAFRDQYRGLAAGARLRHSGVLLLLLDILHLNTINDRYGYAIGDEVLRTVADALMEATHPPDLVSRSGGDEFAVLLINPGPHDIDVAVTHVREKLAELATRQGLPLAVSCSMGIASSHVPPENADELLREADRDMHRKKRDKKRE